MTRVAMLLLALALVQVACPLLFTHYNQWLVSGGVVLGYGSILFQQLRRRVLASRSCFVRAIDQSAVFKNSCRTNRAA